MFPDKIRTLILDGNVNPFGNLADLAMSAKGPEIAMDLVRRKEPSIAASYDEAFAVLQEKPIDLGDGLEFDLGDYIQRVTLRYLLTGDLQFFEELSGIVVNVAANPSGNEEGMMTLTRVKNEILEVGNENAGGVFSVVNRLDCADAYDSQ